MTASRLSPLAHWTIHIFHGNQQFARDDSIEDKKDCTRKREKKNVTDITCSAITLSQLGDTVEPRIACLYDNYIILTN